MVPFSETSVPPPSMAQSFARIKTARPLAIYTMKDGLAANQVWRLFSDSGDNIWVSAFGLARWDRASRTLSNLASAPGLPSLKDNLARSFGEDRAGKSGSDSIPAWHVTVMRASLSLMRATHCRRVGSITFIPTTRAGSGSPRRAAG